MRQDQMAKELSMSDSNNAPAFPQGDAPGMNQLDWFAGQALSGILAGMEAVHPESSLPKPKHVAEFAYELAQAMCEERKKVE